MKRDHRFGSGIVWGTIPIGLLVSVIVPETATEQVQTCGFRKNLSNLEREPKLRDSVRLSSFENFIYSAFNLFKNLGDVFLCHFWIKRVLQLTIPGIFRCFSRNCCYFPLFPQSCHETEGKILSARKTGLKFFILINSDNFLLLWGKRVSIKCKQFDIKLGTIARSSNLYNNNTTLISAIYTFRWRETKLFTRQIEVQIGKCTLIILSLKGKQPTLAGNKHLSVHFFFHGARLFHLSTEKVQVQSVRNGYQSDSSRANTMNNNINKRSEKVSTRGN